MASTQLPVLGHGNISPRKYGNPTPLGLCAFALTTFLLSIINLGSNGLSAPNIVVGPAFAYGGLVQLLAGMWEMAVGNTFGATALTSFGGFWLGTAIILTPGGFRIQAELTTASGSDAAFNNSFGLYLISWFIFCFLLVLCTLKSSLAFMSIFVSLDLAFLLLGIAYLYADADGPSIAILRAGGTFGILSAFAAWYHALAAIAEPSNSFFSVPLGRFPWSDAGKASTAEGRTDGDRDSDVA